MKNAYEADCLMCDQRLFWSGIFDSWMHSKDRSIYCFEKASVATPKEAIRQ